MSTKIDASPTKDAREFLEVKIKQIGLLALAIVGMMHWSVAAQDVPAASTEPGHIIGTVLDTNGESLAGATIVLKDTRGEGPRKSTSDGNGFFEFTQVDPGNYLVTITAPDFADWTSPAFALNPGQYMILTPSKLHLTEVTTSVNVTYTPVEVATEEVKIEETQRVFGIIPNFYVVYGPSPAPLTAKLKFQLAMKTSTDPFTIAGVGVLAAMDQAGGTPDYAGGIRGYSERFGAAAADGLSDIMIGGAILPSLLHQDPRYYYQGTGSTRSRVFHALSSPFVCRGDNGHRQVNVSSVGGDLSSAALSNLYYPPSNRGANLVFENFLLTTGERMLSTVVQEFVLGNLTHRSKDHSALAGVGGSGR